MEEIKVYDFSGPDWCDLFPTSISIDDLASPFKEKCNHFISDLRLNGCEILISATYRPPERAYLMHYACMIAHAKMDPKEVPSFNGVDINWDHGSPARTLEAARQMVAGYGIQYPAALVSRHTQRLAIDMNVLSAGVKIESGKSFAMVKMPAGIIYNVSDLYAIGAMYGVIKLISDPPHWSSDGH